jgi:plasmid stabilization system protein ParE
MAKEVIWTVSAYRDLQNIVSYISEEYDDVMDKADTLMEFPHRGRIVPETGRSEYAGTFYTQVQINLPNKP